MIKSIKLPLYINDDHVDEKINSFINMTRFVYNWALNRSIEYYKETGKRLSWISLNKELTQLKKQEEYKFLNDCDSTSLSTTIRDMYRNLIIFIKTHKGFPHFKSKKKCKLSYYTQCPNTHIRNKNYIQLPKIGLVKIKNYCNLEDKHWIRCTVVKTKSNKYYISITYEDDSIGPQPFHIRRNKVGIDVGIRTLCTFNDGTKIDPPRFYKKSESRIRGLHKSLSRKTSGSNNYEKTRIKLAKAYEKDSNRMNNFIHNLSKYIVDTYDEIHIEDYNASEFYKDNNWSHKTNKAILFSGLGELKRQLIYKSEWYDKKIILADRSYPSTQLCSNCGYQYKGTKNLRVTEWDCPNCGIHHDRDINAAINLVNYYPC